MLNKLTTRIAANVGSGLVSRSLHVVAKPSTLLAELCGTVRSIDNAGVHLYDEGDIAERLCSATEGSRSLDDKSYVNSDHDSLMDNYIAELTQLVQGHVHYARNVVNPRVTAFYTDIIQRSNEFKYRTAEDFFSVIYYKPHDIFESNLFANEMNIYRDMGTGKKHEPFNLSGVFQDGFDLAEYLKIGDTELDMMIASWVGGHDLGKLVGYVNTPAETYHYNNEDLLDLSLVNYLFYRNLSARTDLNVGIPSATLSIRAAASRDYFGALAWSCLNNYRRFVKLGMVFGPDTQCKFSYLAQEPLRVKIYEENFDKLAEAGIPVEVLFGYLANAPATANPNITVDEVIAGHEAFLKTWNTTKSMYMLSVQKDTLNLMQSFIRMAWDKSITDLTEEEQAFVQQKPDYFEAVGRDASKIIGDLTLADVTDNERLELVALNLIAKVRFGFTNAYAILNETNNILKSDPEMKPTEAALYAVVEYLIQFVKEQMEVKPGLGL